MATDKPAESSDTKAKEYFGVYEAHSRTLKTWLVAYGIGAPVLFLSNDSIWQTIRDNTNMNVIGSCFLIGVAVQVVVAGLNKAVMWALYYGEIEASFVETKRYKMAAVISSQIWIDFLADLTTMGLLAIATVLAFVGLMATP